MNDLVRRIAALGELTPALREEIMRAFGHRGTKALAALDAGRVRQYLDFLVVEGSTGEYVVGDTFCTCGDFMFRGRECWHLLAAELAVATGRVIQVPVWYQDRWKDGGNECA